ncbi:MAG TPA: SGNH/GDSL hydrolase family protein [Methylomirabilota bacterium]
MLSRRSLSGPAIALVIAGCTGFMPSAPTRTLPRDHGAAIVYVALGDSTVEGIGATSAAANYVSRIGDRLRAVYPATRVVNLGVGGATSADVVKEQLDEAVRLEPQLVTLSIGPNDITDGRDVAQYERNLDAIFRRLARETEAVLVANLLPDLAVTPRFRASPERAAVAEQTERYNRALARTARHHGVEVVDLFAASRQEVPRHPELVAGDGYHPSDLGYARWAELMWQRIATRIAG